MGEEYGWRCGQRCGCDTDVMCTVSECVQNEIVGACRSLIVQGRGVVWFECNPQWAVTRVCVYGCCVDTQSVFGRLWGCCDMGC